MKTENRLITLEIFTTLRLLKNKNIRVIIQSQKGSEQMYHLNKFCNIIFELRKERRWTQTILAEKLGIAPQSVSKWECGIGYPDVTLFPVIAELFEVDIGVLFGQGKGAQRIMNHDHEKMFIFEPLYHVEFLVGNECEIRVTEKEGEKAFELATTLRAKGIVCDFDHMGRGIKSQFKYADKIGAEYVGVIGSDELSNGVIKLKKMADGTESTVEFSSLAEFVLKND